MHRVAVCVATVADALRNTLAATASLFSDARYLDGFCSNSQYTFLLSFPFICRTPWPLFLSPTSLFALLPAVFGCEPVALAQARLQGSLLSSYSHCWLKLHMRRERASQEDPVDFHAQTHTFHHRQNVEINPRYIIFTF